jgi:putative hydrolase
MSMPGSGGGDFLERLLGDLVSLLGSSSGGSGDQIELARTLARSVATGGEPEANVDPVERMQFEELVRLAEMHVSELTGLSITPRGGPIEVQAVGPGSWAWYTLEDWRFLLDAMSSASTPADTTAEPAARADDLEALSDADVGGAEMIARFVKTMGPMLAAMQLGSAVGHLARTTLGQYEVPVPRPPSRLLVVPQNVERFASDWSLPRDQVRLWICLREVTAHAVLTQHDVGARFRELITDVVRGMAETATGTLNSLSSSMSGLDPSDPDSLQRILGDPETLIGPNTSPARRRAAELLEAATAALLGYVEHVLDRAAARLLGGRGALTEAWRRSQHEREPADRAAEMLLGLDLGPPQVERGSAFVAGVVERAGEDALSRLWSGEGGRNLPTPSEVEAPGLWLERLRMTGELPLSPPENGEVPPESPEGPESSEG